MLKKIICIMVLLLPTGVTLAADTDCSPGDLLTKAIAITHDVEEKIPNDQLDSVIQQMALAEKAEDQYNFAEACRIYDELITKYNIKVEYPTPQKN